MVERLVQLLLHASYTNLFQISCLLCCPVPFVHSSMPVYISSLVLTRYSITTVAKSSIQLLLSAHAW